MHSARSTCERNESGPVHTPVSLRSSRSCWARWASGFWCGGIIDSPMLAVVLVLLAPVFLALVFIAVTSRTVAGG